MLQQVGIISGHVKKFFRDDDYKAGFSEKRKEACHKALEQILQGLQNLAIYIEGDKGNYSLMSIAKGECGKVG